MDMLLVEAGPDIGLGKGGLFLVLVQEPAEVQDLIGMRQCREPRHDGNELLQLHRVPSYASGVWSTPSPRVVIVNSPVPTFRMCVGIGQIVETERANL